jgi:hypothetical protein
MAFASTRRLLGLAEVALGHLREGMPNIYLGLNGLNESGAGIMMTLYLCWIAIAVTRRKGAAGARG